MNSSAKGSYEFGAFHIDGKERLTLSDRITEDPINSLSQIPGLRVVSRTTNLDGDFCSRFLHAVFGFLKVLLPPNPGTKMAYQYSL